MSAAHTPGPWRVVRANPSPTTGEYMIAGAKPGYIAEVRDCGTGDVAANARRIVQCVNSHDALVEALREAREALADGLWDYGPGQDEHIKCDEVIARCDAVIAAATVEAAS